MSPTPALLEDLDRPYELPRASVDGFRRDGHAVVRGLARRPEVETFRPVIEAEAVARAYDKRPLEERETYGKAFLQSFNLWRVDPLIRAFVFARRFAHVAAELLGVDGVRLYHDQALFKEPGGGPTPWHQDQVYWPLDSDATITLWMPLIDLPEEVGSMRFASGSHRFGDLCGKAISDASEDELGRIVAERGFPVVTHGALAAGDATFHSGWTAHSAGPNPTDTMRSVMTVIYFADGTRVAEPRSPEQELDLRIWLGGAAPGTRIEGELNPKLWP